MRVVLTGGGTGGHVIPNLAVTEELKKKKKIDFLYIGSFDGPEKRLVEKYGLRFEAIQCGKMRRYFSRENLKDFFKVFVGTVQARKILKNFKPDVIFSKGGYVALPVVFAAYSLKIPIIVHESDVIPGLANRIAFRMAKRICVSYEESLKYLSANLKKKTLLTGNPVRESIARGDFQSALKFTGLTGYRPVILVMGGSQGAKQINELVRKSLDQLLKKFQVVHITGKGNLDIGTKKTGYVQYEYLDEQIKDIYALSEFVVTRGGANSLSELAYLRKKVLIIPLTKNASRGEQEVNAEIFAKNFGWSMVKGDISHKEFPQNVLLAFNNDFNRKAKFKNGVKSIANLILKI